VIGEFLMRETGALVTHTNIVAVTLLGLGMMGVVRYVRRRNRRLAGPMEVPQRPMATMAQRGYMQHRPSKSMASISSEASYRYMHRYRSNSVSSGSNQTPSPSPLRQAPFIRPFSGGYEERDLESQQPMSTDVTGYGPVTSLTYGDHARTQPEHSAYPSMMQPYGSREDTEFLKEMSRRGSMLDAGHGKV
jgi:hypothetical protein